MIYRDIEIAIRNKLIADTRLQELLGVDTLDIQSRIYVGHIANVTNPVFPCITFKIMGGGANANQFTVSPKLHMNVWCKGDVDGAQIIYERVRQLLHKQPVQGAGIAQVLEISYEEGLYEKATRTSHIAVYYEIQAVDT